MLCNGIHEYGRAQGHTTSLPRCSVPPMPFVSDLHSVLYLMGLVVVLSSLSSNLSSFFLVLGQSFLQPLLKRFVGITSTLFQSHNEQLNHLYTFQRMYVKS